MAVYPEKKEMILLTDRPPQLETPLKIFRQDFTPNEYFFVRWHMSQIVTKIDIDTFHLYIKGAVNKQLSFTMSQLKNEFRADSVAALAICAGNSRATFIPCVPGSQWQNGAMGNARWKGVRLKDLLEKAGVNPNAVDVTFQGMDMPPMAGVPPFIKALRVARAMDTNIIVAYEMNGAPLPMLNGYPLKLVVPGWYATYWVGALNYINVMTDTFKGYWMAKAYQVSSNPGMNESPDNISKATVPITNINLHSIFVEPDATQQVEAGKHFTVEGLAFNDGTPINKVELSFDDGSSWTNCQLNPELGKFAWRRWHYDWVPAKKGIYHLCVKATDANGKTQPAQQWNKSGYARGFIEHLDVNVN